MSIKEVKRVTKRDGTFENYDVEKIHASLQNACEGILGVSVSDIAMKTDPQVYDGIPTQTLEDMTASSCEDLISEDHPNYSRVLARLLITDLRKRVFGTFEPERLIEVVKKNVERGVYDAKLLDWYTDDEWLKLGAYIKHDRDYNLSGAAVKQIRDKYLVQDRSSKTYFETPQVMFMLIPVVAFRNRPKKQRLQLIRETYDMLSTFKISLPTPILAGLRTSIKQFSSCVLIDVGDDLDSIDDASKVMGRYAAKRAGLGINGGKLRPLGSKVGKGEIVHTGVTPFYRQFESTVKSRSQGGIRDASVTLYAPIWHAEAEQIMTLKDNRKTHEKTVRRLDYAMQWDMFLLRRARNKQMMTLFSPHEVPDLYKAFFGRDRSLFESLYEKYEKDETLKFRVQVNARDILDTFHKQSQETGRIYGFNADHVNTHSPFLKPVTMSNLCVEICLPTEPVRNVMTDNGDGTGTVTYEGLVQLCTLAAINVGNLNLDDHSDMERRMWILVNLLNEILDYQDYMIPQARMATMKYRPLGIGVINYAYLIAKNGQKYNDQRTFDMTHRLAEQMHYYALKASVELAKEHGAIPGLEDTIYSKGGLLIDSYCKAVDEITKQAYECDWKWIREQVNLYGVYNSTLLALMPSESSSVVSNATNGIEPLRQLVTRKGNKKVTMVQVAPDAVKLKSKYDYLWDMTAKDYDGYIKNVAIFQKFTCQSISTNFSYNRDHYRSEDPTKDRKIPLEVLMNHTFLAAKYGVKTRYYVNTKGEKDNTEDEKKGEVAEEAKPDLEEDDGEDGCAGGACKI
jgi:ribonucleoside-diphosphate reductase alpha chain